MFHMLPSYSPVTNQDFIWVAEYADGTNLSEFDFLTHEEHSFYSIKRSDIIRFGLVGLGNRLYFEGFGGSFKIAGRSVDFIYEVDGKRYSLSGKGIMYNDLITYKDVESYTDLITGQSGGISARIVQFNFGYKTKLEFDDVNFHFQALCQVPFGEPLRFNVKLVADRELDGKLIIVRNGVNEIEFDAPLQKEVGGELTWLMR